MIALAIAEVSADSATWWQYLLLFLAVTASWAGVPFIGAAAAGAAGVAVSFGRMNLFVAVIVVTVAGEVGGLIGYHIGVRWGRQILERPGKHQNFRLNMLAKGERAYAKWGRVAIFFTPSIVSGTARMNRRQFVIWNLIDSLGFALTTLGAAYGLSRLLSGHHGAVDIVILVGFVAVGGTLMLIVRRHHRRAIGQAHPVQSTG